MHDATTLAPGAAVDPARRYVVHDVLGAGSFGVVYRVYDQHWRQEVALKTLRSPSPMQRQWLKAEYRTLRDIVHPNLVRLHELHVDDARCFFTMDIVDGGVPFTERLRVPEGPPAAHPAAVRRVCGAAAQLADALQAVQRHGKCHRDIKPSNVLVTPADHVVLLDFGLASPVDRTRVLDTARGVIVGTLPYLAPEQYDDPAPLPASDWYSLGLLLHQTLVGALPFGDNLLEEFAAKQRGFSPAALHGAELPDALVALLLGLLAPDPTARPAPDRVVQTLRALAGERAPSAPARLSPQLGEGDFIAREGERAAVRDAFRRAAHGRFTMVELVGPSGIGKTALAREALRELAASERGCLVLEARCHPQESIPYKALDAVVDDLARLWLGLDEEAARALVPPTGADALTHLFPELRRVGHLAALHREELAGDPRSLRDEGFAALRAVFATLCARSGVALWVDDLQWADADSLALLDALFGEGVAPPVMLLVSRRPEAADDDPVAALCATLRHRAEAARLDLPPLTLEDAASLARRITARVGRDSPDAVAAIVREAGGVPYLLAELAHFTVEGDAATNVGSLLRARLDTLDPTDRAMVELAALAGDALPAETLLRAAASTERRRLRDLCVARMLRWSVARDEAVLIYHDRLREFVDGDLAPARARELHQALLHALERGADADPQRLLHHAMAAGDRARAHRHALTAARQAEAALAFNQAARLYALAHEHLDTRATRTEVETRWAEALANAGRSGEAASRFESAARALAQERPEAPHLAAALRRRAGEQYLKSGRYADGLRLLDGFLAEAGVRLPRSGRGALLASTRLRARLYLRGFAFNRRPATSIAGPDRQRLDDLWAATTALSMMDPVRADSVGLVHFLDALRLGDGAHVARSLGYEAAFAALIGGHYLRGRASALLARNQEALRTDGGPYERGFYALGAGTAAFFHSRWRDAVTLCDEADAVFRAECRGAEYEAAVARVFSLQALGQAGAVAELVRRIPAAIREADARGDLFAANNYRGGFHALGRVAAGHLDEVKADVQRVVETWQPGFYQMHAYHRVFASVAADLYLGDAASALARVEGDWSELEAGLFLVMELPAVELRWTRARALLGVANAATGRARARRVRQVRHLAARIDGATVAAARPHAALVRASLAQLEGDRPALAAHLRVAVDGYAAAEMALHREVARHALAAVLPPGRAEPLRASGAAWCAREGVADITRLTAAIAPGLEELARDL
ncbi:MAG: AAA family ATPase [Polyangiales bacterium]